MLHNGGPAGEREPANVYANSIFNVYAKSHGFAEGFPTVRDSADWFHSNLPALPRSPTLAAFPGCSGDAIPRLCIRNFSPVGQPSTMA